MPFRPTLRQSRALLTGMVFVPRNEEERMQIHLEPIRELVELEKSDVSGWLPYTLEFRMIGIATGSNLILDKVA